MMNPAPVALEFAAGTEAEASETLVLGHSLGTSAALWDGAVPSLEERFRVLRWELPGHGDARPASSAYRVEDLADALIATLDRHRIDSIHFAGVSITGCVGLDLALRYPERISTVAVISTGARVDDPALMRGRAATARADGMRVFVEPFRARWFAPGAPQGITEKILGLLSRTDPESYALAAEALADFDVWDDLPHIGVPLLAVGGQEDHSVPVERSFELATRVGQGVGMAIPHAAHSLVAEKPGTVSQALIDFIEQNRSDR